MSSDMLLTTLIQHKHNWEGYSPYKCCDTNVSHFAIIAKGNKIEGMEAKI